MSEPIPEWRDDHYHRVIQSEGFTYNGPREAHNSLSFITHPDPDMRYRVKAIHTYTRRIQKQDEYTQEHVQSVIKRLQKAIARLERKLYPDRIRPIQVYVEMHPLSKTAEEQGTPAFQDYWRIIVQELGEVERQKPRKTRTDG